MSKKGFILPFTLLLLSAINIISVTLAVPEIVLSCILNAKIIGMISRSVILAVSGVFATAASLISFWLIRQHQNNMSKPAVQSKIVGIIWMVPIYSIDSFLSLAIPSIAIYINMLRDCYEAYVLYLFLSLMLAYLGCEEDDFDIVAYLETKASFKQPFPLNYICTQDVPRGRAFLRYCKFGLLQYCLIRPATTLAAIILELLGVYRENDFSGRYGYLYVLVIINASVFYAFVVLANFYSTLKDKLTPFEPVGKFLCIKFVIFFAFWQSVVITCLVRFGVITDIGDYSAHAISTGLQDFLICIEMFVTAVAHLHTFSHKPFTDGYVSPLYRKLSTNPFDEEFGDGGDVYSVNMNRSNGGDGDGGGKALRSNRGLFSGGAGGGAGGNNRTRLQYSRGGVSGNSSSSGSYRAPSDSADSAPGGAVNDTSIWGTRKYSRGGARGPLDQLRRSAALASSANDGRPGVGSSNSSRSGGNSGYATGAHAATTSPLPTKVPAAPQRKPSSKPPKFTVFAVGDDDDDEASQYPVYDTLVPLPVNGGAATSPLNPFSIDAADDEGDNAGNVSRSAQGEGPIRTARHSHSSLLTSIQDRYATDDNSGYLHRDDTEEAMLRRTSKLAAKASNNRLSTLSSSTSYNNSGGNIAIAPGGRSYVKADQNADVAQWGGKTTKERVSSIESRLGGGRQPSRASSSTGGSRNANVSAGGRSIKTTGVGSTASSILESHFAASTAIRDFNESMPVIVLPSNFQPKTGTVVHSDPASRLREANAER